MNQPTFAGLEYNRECGRTRSRAEHVFGVIKNLWGYRKTRYRGLRKNGAQVYALVALANFYMARDKRQFFASEAPGGIRKLIRPSCNNE